MKKERVGGGEKETTREQGRETDEGREKTKVERTNKQSYIKNKKIKIEREGWEKIKREGDIHKETKISITCTG